jgi:acetate kinase
MGLTPLGGIPMGTRSGDLDPSVLTYLMKKEGLTAEQMEDILNKKSGVYGVSRVSMDFRDIEYETLAGGAHAKLSLDIFCYLISEYIMKCAVAMGGIDVLTFTAGVGEKSPYCRENICNSLKFLGARLDINKNEVKGEEKIISKDNSSIKICVVPTNEELMIARETLKLI